MNIKEKEDRLFGKWSVDYKNFIPDGVVDEVKYNKSLIKIMFVLKEANDPDGGGWDLREFIKNGAKKQTWNNITRWVYGIRNISKDIEWRSIENINKEQRKAYLSSICAINLKKTPGGYEANNSKLAEATKRDYKYFNQQINIYNPDLTICCGSIVSELFHNIVFSERPNWLMTKRGIYFHEYKHKKFIVEYSHPAARINDSLLYYGLIDAIKEIYRFKVNTL